MTEIMLDTRLGH